MTHKRLVVLILLPLACRIAAAQSNVAFYFAAHQDDWQLFMNPSAYNDVQSASAKVVFVYFTAGDAGAGIGNAGRAQPYYLARENGAKLSVKFMADAEKMPAVAVESAASIGGHGISRWAYRNTVSYFLRLPDGGNGMGYPTTGGQSLKRFRDGAIATLTAVDDSTTYYGWSDLTETIRLLVDSERGNAGTVWLNLPDTNLEANLNDHSDHQHTAMAVLDAVAGLTCANRALFLNYVTSKMEENLNSTERQAESGTFGAMVAGLVAFDHRSTWDTGHRAWLGRNYFRTEPGSGSCGE